MGKRTLEESLMARYLNCDIKKEKFIETFKEWLEKTNLTYEQVRKMAIDFVHKTDKEREDYIKEIRLMGTYS